MFSQILCACVVTSSASIVSEDEQSLLQAASSADGSIEFLQETIANGLENGLELFEDTAGAMESVAIGVDPDEPCSILTVKINSKEENSTIGTSDECSAKGWGLDLDAAATCEPAGETFPKVCKFPTILNDVPEKAKESAPQFIAKSLLELQASVNHTYEMERLESLGGFQKFGIKRARKGRRDEQYQWAAKVMAKAYLATEGCKPSTVGKPAARHMDCHLCWAGPFPHPCNCDCRGWIQHLTLCYEPCSGRGEYTHDSGVYCHKPCDREGQLANTVGCGFGEARTCFESSGECAKSIATKVWAITDVLASIGTAGAFKAMTAAATTAKTVGVKAAMATMKAAMRASVTKMAKNVASKAWVKKKLASYSKTVRDNILENGATLFLTQSLPGEDPFLEVASIVDPTGITGVVSEFLPKESCDDTSYMNDPVPQADDSKPDLPVLDECRVDDAGSCAGSLSWQSQAGFCKGYKGYNMCRFSQEHGWHPPPSGMMSMRSDSLWKGSLWKGRARTFCKEEAKDWGAVGSVSSIKDKWHHCWMFYANITCEEAGATRRPGYYEETIGRRRRRDGPLTFGGDTKDYYYCHKRR